MENDLAIEQIKSLVLEQRIQPLHNTVSRKFWHIICKAEVVIPLGLSSMKVSIFLIYFEGRLFLSIVLEFFQMLPAPQENIELPVFPQLSDHSSLDSIPLPQGPIPIGYGVFELPECPRCFLGYTCSTHHPQHQ